MAKQWITLKRCLGDIITTFLVCSFSLSVLIYVAQGKGGNTYQQFYRDANIAQGQMVQSALEAFLRLDLPLRQFARFGPLSEPLLDGSSAVARISVLDEHGRVVFTSKREDAAAETSVGDGLTAQGTLAKGDIVLPLRGKFETAGSLVLQPRLTTVAARVSDAFRPLWVLMLLCSAGFSLLTFLLRNVAWQRKGFWTAAAFVATFIGMAIIVTATLVGLYADGASAKGRALLASLSGRLADVTAYRLNFDQLEGLDRVFAEYRRLNPDIYNIALLIDGNASVHTDSTRVGHKWKPVEGTYEYVADISAPGSAQAIQVAVTLPKDVVYRKIFQSIRNILALFVASGLFAYFAMNAARTLQHARRHEDRDQLCIAEIGLGLVKPIFFLGTFIEHLIYSFLPNFVQDVMHGSGVPAQLMSMPFIAYYICFALSLVPAERIAFRFGPNKLIWGGLLLASCGLLTLSGEFGFASIVLARALSGVGQGLLFIGVQTYILRTTSLDQRTRGASVIVVGFQAGMISGMAIGSLLVSQIDTRGVFLLGAAIAVIAAIYAVAFLPVMAVSEAEVGRNRMALWRNIMLTLRDLEFLRTISLIGLPAKAVLTGVILFALPLLLAAHGYDREDVGQINMMYGAAVIFCSAWVSARVYRPHTTEGILVWGAMLSGLGLLMVAGVDWRPGGFDVTSFAPATVVIVCGVIVVGAGHGFINAPIITQVTDLRIAGRLGAAPVAATYRLLERAGHTAGPMIVAQIMATTASGAIALGWIGGGLIAMALVFALSSLRHDDGLEVETA